MRAAHAALRRVQRRMLRLAIVLALLVLMGWTSRGEVFAAAGPQRFLCSKLDIGCRKHPRTKKAAKPKPARPHTAKPITPTRAPAPAKAPTAAEEEKSAPVLPQPKPDKQNPMK